MSKRSPTRVVSSFASHTAFEALAVESGEESEDEEIVGEEESGTTSQETGVQTSLDSTSMNQSPKLTKTAQKKAARLARQHLKQEKRDKRDKSAGSGSEEQTSGRDTPPPGTQRNPVEILPEVESDTSAVFIEKPEEQRSVPAALTTLESEPASNGHISHTNAPTQSVPIHPSSTIKKPTAFPISPIDLAMRRASRSLTDNPLARKPINTEAQAIEPTYVPADPEKSVKEAESVKKRQSFFVRTLWTLIMIAGFLLCLAAGHAYMIMLVMVIQTLVYREVTALFSLGAPKPKTDDDTATGKDPWSNTLNWYFFVVANFFLYGESIIYYFKHVVFSDWHFSLFAANHRFTSFSLYTIGFVGFVYSLQRQHLKSQFGLFCWVHMTLLVIVVSSHFIMNNILEGLIWFWVPASLVICNDIFAYIWGITMGRTPLFKLSPKKTVEGFVGAFFSTILFGQLWGTLFMRSYYMICPAHDLGVNFFSNYTCTPNPVFVWRISDVSSVPYAPYQFHLLVMSCFASLVAPFGGFFASGFKRAFDIKDFGHSIPGHGGMTDRMDCQFLMGIFTYVYYSSLVKEHHVTVGQVLQLIASGLTLEDQLELMRDFRRYLEGRGISV
ncbi:hypothetical protein EW145_g2746 [Phellinidium pouzarii]|uniref:Phosphatidate cytidylyltransferase n=1 Tax=Phellinidium pouzarii TaxID=167371 RepID=A0A4S4L9W5_9AGAM|nr:hypothetical protein EW145_g2746 [Phellinidium pouzarii]